MSFPVLTYTYRDLIQHLVNTLQGVGFDQEQFRIRQAIQEAYRQLIFAYNWKYLFKPESILLDAAYSTGTIAYTNSTRTVTLTDGTFPSWSIYGHIRIGNAFYQVDTNPTSTTVTLREDTTPGQDVASGTTYTLYQSRYPLPGDFRRMMQAATEGYTRQISWIPPDQWYSAERSIPTSGVALYATIMGEPRLPGRMSVFVYPYPATAATIGFLMQRFARPLRISGYEGYNTGTISTSDGITITGSGTAFTSAMVGSALRIGTTSAVPDGIEGSSPYVEQSIIKSVASTTSLTVVPTLQTTSYTSVKYQITDPIDLPTHLVTTLYRGAELQLAVIKGGKDIALRKQLYDQAVLEAIQADYSYLDQITPQGPTLPGSAIPEYWISSSTPV